MKKIFIISGPSGAGEDSVIEGLEKYFDLEKIITTTTRAPRQDESEGDPYYFISQDKFKAKLNNQKFVEHDFHNDNYYGLTKKELERIKKLDKLAIWKTDIEGVKTTKKLFPEIKSILIYAPLEIIEERIRNRGDLSEERIEERIDYAKEWLENKNIYDYQVENKQNKLKETVEQVVRIIQNNL